MQSILSSPAIDNLSYPVIFTGSRHWRNRYIVRAILSELKVQHPGLVVIHGGQVSYGHGEAWGADYIVALMREELYVPQRVYPVSTWEWEKYGKAAGPRRNQRMYDENPDVRETIGLFAWNAAKGAVYPARGTQNCLRIGAKRGIPQRYFYENETVEHVLSRLRAEAA